MRKICCLCKEIKEIIDFYRDKKGYLRECKKCKETGFYYNLNKEKNREKGNLYYNNNKEKIKEKIKEKRKEYRETKIKLKEKYILEHGNEIKN